MSINEDRPAGVERRAIDGCYPLLNSISPPPGHIGNPPQKRPGVSTGQGGLQLQLKLRDVHLQGGKRSRQIVSKRDHWLAQDAPTPPPPSRVGLGIGMGWHVIKSEQ